MKNGSLFSAINFKILIAGIAVITIGYILLGQGPVDNHLSMSVAPILLVFAYVVIFPLAILYRGKNEESTSDRSVEKQK